MSRTYNEHHKNHNNNGLKKDSHHSRRMEEKEYIAETQKVEVNDIDYVDYHDVYKSKYGKDGWGYD